MARDLRGRAGRPQSHRGAARAPDLPRCAASIRRARCAGPSTRVATLAFNVLGLLAVYALQRLQGVAAAQSAGPRRRRRRTRVQHGGELRHQHELAGLRRRDDDELSHADARAHRAELRLGGDRHGGARRVRPRLPARSRSATIGNFWVDLTRTTLYILLPLSLVARARPGLAGRGADVLAVQDGRARAAGRRTTRPRSTPRASR